MADCPTRPSARQRGYDSAWERARASFLRLRKWCEHEVGGQRCGKPAEHVHHAVAHKGDKRVFWDKSKWVPLCAEHHNRDAQQVETRGYANRVGSDGMPADRAHPFHAKGDAALFSYENAQRIAAEQPTPGGEKVKRNGREGPPVGSREELVSEITAGVTTPGDGAPAKRGRPGTDVRCSTSVRAPVRAMYGKMRQNSEYLANQMKSWMGLLGEAVTLNEQLRLKTLELAAARENGTLN